MALLGTVLGFLPVWSHAAAIPKAGWTVEYVTIAWLWGILFVFPTRHLSFSLNHITADTRAA